MEESAKDQPSSITQGNGADKPKLRYILRSSSKFKDQAKKSPNTPSIPYASTSKRGRPSASVSKSVSVVELSGKDKCTEPPRRLSIPSKSTVSPRPKSGTNVTPISETRARWSVNQPKGRCETPVSSVSNSPSRRKFNLLSSASYWVSQIKRSECDGKHSVSLGFFKLALEAECEPRQLLCEELKSYARRHRLGELENSLRGLLESYEISETLEQLQVSETCSQSHAPEQATSLSTRKLKPKSLNTNTQACSPKMSSIKENAQKTNIPSMTRSSVNRNLLNPRSVAESGGNNIKKKVQQPGKESNDKEHKIKMQGKKTVVEQVIAKSLDIQETREGNKENMNASVVGEISEIEEN